MDDDRIGGGDQASALRLYFLEFKNMKKGMNCARY
jgi:hypothetical protein